LINRAKRRHVAYVFATITFVFLVISFLIAQKGHSESNWYVTMRPGDSPHSFIFYPNIPYTIKSDDWITYLSFLTKEKLPKKYKYFSDYTFTAPGLVESILGGYPAGTCLHYFNITFKDTTCVTINVQLSGFVYESGHYEIHKDKAEGKSIYYSNKKCQFISLEEFNLEK
jgi:hypothetical protein